MVGTMALGPRCWRMVLQDPASRVGAEGTLGTLSSSFRLHERGMERLRADHPCRARTVAVDAPRGDAI